MRKMSFKTLWPAIKSEITTTPLYFVRRIIFVLAIILRATRVIGLIPYSIIFVIHGFVSFIAMKRYRDIDAKVSMNSKYWFIGSIIALILFFLHRYMMIKEGVPLSYIRWW